MRKIFLMMAMCLSVFTFVSCGDDEEIPAYQYQWGIYPGEYESVSLDENNQPSPLYTWLENEIATLNKTGYEGQQRTSNEESILARMESATQSLDQLTAKFEEWKKNNDVGSVGFNASYVFRIYKNGEILKESRVYHFDLNISQYQWGIYSGETTIHRQRALSSPLYTWLENEIATLNQAGYEGCQSTNNEESVIALMNLMDGATRALDQLTANFEEWKRTKDADDLEFKTSYQFRIYKDGEILKESQEYPFEQKYEGHTRVEADNAFNIQASAALKHANDISGTLRMKMEDMGLFDGGKMEFELAGDPTLVNAETLEFAKGSFLSNYSIELVDGANYHTFSMIYKLSKSSIATWKGNWYILVPLHISEAGAEGMTFDVKIPVIVG